MNDVLVAALLALQLEVMPNAGDQPSPATAYAVTGVAHPTNAILCPAYPGDPPWRPMTCYILSRLGEPWDRPRKP